MRRQKAGHKMGIVMDSMALAGSWRRSLAKPRYDICRHRSTGGSDVQCARHVRASSSPKKPASTVQHQAFHSYLMEFSLSRCGLSWQTFNFLHAASRGSRFGSPSRTSRTATSSELLHPLVHIQSTETKGFDESVFTKINEDENFGLMEVAH